MGKPKTISLELDSEAVEAAAAAGLDLAKVLAEALSRKLPALHEAERETAAREWYEGNKQAVDFYNRFIAEHGLFSDGLRKF